MILEGLDILIKIDGIGPQTLKDIKMIYSSIGELKDSLKKNKVPLRDDVVESLKTYFDY